MQANIERSKGLVFSQRVLLKLAEGGLSREDAYAATQRNAMKVWKGGDGDHFLDMLLSDEQVVSVVKEADIRSCFDLKLYINNVDYIFDRVFKKKK
jgi:adenylosuccinate lyase